MGSAASTKYESNDAIGPTPRSRPVLRDLNVKEVAKAIEHCGPEYGLLAKSLRAANGAAATGSGLDGPVLERLLEKLGHQINIEPPPGGPHPTPSTPKPPLKLQVRALRANQASLDDPREREAPLGQEVKTSLRTSAVMVVVWGGGPSIAIRFPSDGGRSRCLPHQRSSRSST